MSHSAPAGPRAAAETDKLDRGIIVISLVVVLGAIMSILDTTIVNVALALAHAFTTTFWWAVGLTAVGVIPAVVLAFTGRRASGRVEAAPAEA